MHILKLTLGAFQSNCYIGYDEESSHAFVVDPGSNGQEVVQTIKEKADHLDYILLTHAHVDHIGGVAEVKKAFPDAKLLIHQEDQDLLADANLNMSTQAMGYPVSLQADQYVKDGDVLPFGNEEIKVIHTPGHTKGGVCYLIGDVCFTGDTLFSGSIGRSDFYGGDYDTLIHSIITQLMVLPDDVRILPGHMENSTIGREKKINMFIRKFFQ